MPRRGAAKKREKLPDHKYNSMLLAEIINNVMRKGKKSTAESIVYNALDIVEQKMKESPMKILNDSIENLKPLVEVKSRRVGGATYQVPTEVHHTRALALSIKWLVNYSRGRGERSMEEKLAAEIMDAYAKRGSAYKKREDVHRMAEANRAFAHYRW